MARQYKRAYTLTIIPKDGNSKVITELRISFEITKSLLSFPNLASISIYNANKDTLALLQKRFTQVILNAGYENDEKLIFKGEVRNVFQPKGGVDRITTLYAGDGQKDWQNATFNKTFTENIAVNKVIEDILTTFSNTAVGSIEGLPTTADKLRGQTLSGSSKDILDMYAEEYSFNWSIQDGEIVIIPEEQTITGLESVLITSATGMIGSPTITEIGANVTTLLNPRLLPNRVFTIESIASDISLGNLFFRDVKRTSAEGNYKVQEVIFKGDSRIGDWLSLVKGRIVNE